MGNAVARGGQSPKKAKAKPRAKAKPKGGKNPSAPARLKLASGGMLTVDPEDLEAVEELSWRPHQHPVTGLTYWGAWSQGAEVFLGAFVMGLHRKAPKPGHLVIHLNGDLADGRKENLVVALFGAAQQRRSVKKRGGASESSYIGVSAMMKNGLPTATGKWIAKIRLFDPKKRESQTLYLRSWASEELAAQAYDNAAVQIHGPHARVNFPQDNDGKD